MDLNNIELSGTMVADLYQSSLVDGTVAKEKAAVLSVSAKPIGEENITWKSLGNNQRNILIIVKSSDAVYLPDNELDFLTGILGACKFSLADVAIVNLAGYPDASYKELTTFFKSKIVLLFDIEPANFGLPMSFPHYQLQPFANNSFLYSPSLKNLENDKVEKSKLWVCLKRLFNL
ncbi:hypothetical protein CAP36_03900 [Chitinophagaceae bacterium IBVUCB2]|nr:hypothetical protein CAP36_03900 [Chitinophagaceae bacterium IBVUCB2]